MLQPKKRKYIKEFRGDMGGLAIRGSELTHGEYGLQTIDRAWIRSRQIESARKAIVNYTSRKGKLWIKVFPHKPVTKKSDEVVRGGGKGPVDHFVAVVLPGRILFELSGLPDDISREALKRASSKLGVRTKIITKNQ